MFSIGIGEFAVIALLGLVLVLPFWKIFSKAGFSGWLSLSQIVPGLNVLVLFYVAYAEWPALRGPSRSNAEEERPWR